MNETLAKYDAFEQLVMVFSNTHVMLPGIDAQLNKTIINFSAKILGACSMENKFGKACEFNDSHKEHALMKRVSNVQAAVSWSLGRIAKDLITIVQKKEENKEEGEAE